MNSRKKVNQLLKDLSMFFTALVLHLDTSSPYLSSKFLSPIRRYGARLVSVKENNKFRRTADGASNNGATSLKDFVSNIKQTYGLR